MVVLIHRKTALIVFLVLFLGSISFLIVHQKPALQSTFSSNSFSRNFVVIDAGHGGEDGGAVSESGIPESQVNLEISMRLQGMFRFCGQRVTMTRIADHALDQGEATIQQRKAADLKKRVAIANHNTSSALISIHQNSLPSSRITHGAQVFWNHIDPAEELAEAVQSQLNSSINIRNHKQTRQIPSSVYLMKHTLIPAILVECGFLSNKEEASLLQTPNHQQKLALSIASGFLHWRAGEETYETKNAVLLHRMR